jgi:hypothetical protein
MHVIFSSQAHLPTYTKQCKDNDTPFSPETLLPIMNKTQTSRDTCLNCSRLAMPISSKSNVEATASHHACMPIRMGSSKAARFKRTAVKRTSIQKSQGFFISFVPLPMNISDEHYFGPHGCWSDTK